MTEPQSKKKKRGGNICSVIFCSNGISENVSLHRLPTNVETREKWLNFIEKTRMNVRHLSNIYVCSDHFAAGDFNTPLKLQDMESTKFRRVLQRNAVPTIYPKSPPRYSSFKDVRSRKKMQNNRTKTVFKLEKSTRDELLIESNELQVVEIQNDLKESNVSMCNVTKTSNFDMDINLIKNESWDIMDDRVSIEDNMCLTKISLETHESCKKATQKSSPQSFHRSIGVQCEILTANIKKLEDKTTQCENSTYTEKSRNNDNQSHSVSEWKDVNTSGTSYEPSPQRKTSKRLLNSVIRYLKNR